MTLEALRSTRNFVKIQYMGQGEKREMGFIVLVPFFGRGARRLRKRRRPMAACRYAEAVAKDNKQNYGPRQASV